MKQKGGNRGVGGFLALSWIRLQVMEESVRE